jgi:hypothetical protein
VRFYLTRNSGVRESFWNRKDENCEFFSVLRPRSGWKKVAWPRDEMGGAAARESSPRRRRLSGTAEQENFTSTK